MSASTELSPFDPQALPSAISRYLRLAGEGTDRAAAVTTFATDAHVRDEGIDHHGRDAVLGWLTGAASEFTYTTSYVGQSQEEPDRWTIGARLEGDFPGGVADLRFRFTLRDGLISDLVIAP